MTGFSGEARVRAWAIVLLLLLPAAGSAGVTIHYEGTARSAEHAVAVGKEAARLAKAKGWRFTAQRNGVVLHPHPRCEPVELLFEGATTLRPSFVKTQFAGASVHVAVVELLRALEKHFERLEVADEGEYWETSSLPRLTENLRQVESMLRQIRARQPDAIGPLLLPSGRIVDVARGSLDPSKGPAKPLPEEARAEPPRAK